MTQAFNLSQLANNVNTSGLLNAAAGLYNQVPVANGGTGVATLASGAVVLGAGTSAVTTVAAGTTGNVLTSNGTAWVSQIASGGTPIVRLYTSPSPWTKSPTLKAIKVTAVGGGGAGGAGLSAPGLPINYYVGGAGGIGGQGYYFAQAAAIPGPVTVTAGSGGTAPAGAGGASSFGALFSVGGGNGGTAATTPGSGTPGAPGFTLSITSTPNATTINALSGLAYGVQGAQASTTPASNGGAATGYGYGGGGGRGTGGLGGAGSAGFVIVEEFY